MGPKPGREVRVTNFLAERKERSAFTAPSPGSQSAGDTPSLHGMKAPGDRCSGHSRGLERDVGMRLARHRGVTFLFLPLQGAYLCFLLLYRVSLVLLARSGPQGPLACRCVSGSGWQENHS